MYPLYSPGPAPSDYYVFLSIMNDLAERLSKSQRCGDAIEFDRLKSPKFNGGSKEGTFSRVILFCSVFTRVKLKYLGSHTFVEPRELTRISISCINKFLINAKLFVDI